MGLKLAIVKETSDTEKRVAASPDTVKKFKDLGCTVTIQSNAGKDAALTDQAFKDASAKIEKTAADTLKGADILLCVAPPKADTLKSLKKGALVIGLFSPHTNKDLIQSFKASGVTAMAMELVPRITRAQSMDALSSQSNLAGYKAVLDATEHFTRAFPMMMTAAGTVPPAKVFIMGAGVAGLQAIATARRLGAVVSATDVRPAAKEQVESLGATFVAVEDEEFKKAETAGGYAKEMSKTYQKKQQALIEDTIKKQDIVITTALIPGRPAPKLITEAMVKSMQPGSVIVDLAVETGGNCALSEVGKVVEKDGVKIIGHRNVPSRLATNASALYARNLLSLVSLMIDKESGALKIDWDDDIIKAITLTHGGKIVHPAFGITKPTAKKAPAKKATPKKTTAKKTATKKKTTKTT
ncbi:MAG: Re/Si-specific NAD(P)(+) transhydrogenase subunit alpha [Alphaproteobacteria bacterium]|nr:Re/Si-specific NAD(P)(+) transhydrogenase subunit alpha [Alphaproteobacteria bacterium]